MTKSIEATNHKYCEDAIALEAVGRTVYFSLAQMLYKIRQERLYEPYWETWMDYCYEFKDLSPSSISKLVNVFEIFMLKYGYSAEQLSETAGWTKLYQIASHVHTKKDADPTRPRERDYRGENRYPDEIVRPP